MRSGKRPISMAASALDTRSLNIGSSAKRNRKHYLNIQKNIKTTLNIITTWEKPMQIVLLPLK